MAAVLPTRTPITCSVYGYPDGCCDMASCGCAKKNLADQIKVVQATIDEKIAEKQVLQKEIENLTIQINANSAAIRKLANMNPGVKAVVTATNIVTTFFGTTKVAKGVGYTRSFGRACTSAGVGTTCKEVGSFAIKSTRLTSRTG